MALLDTLQPSTLLLIIPVYILFTSVIGCNTQLCQPTLPGTTTIPGIPVQPGTPQLQAPSYLSMTPPSLPETPTLNFPPSIPVTPTLYFPPFLPVTPPSLPKTPTLPAPYLPVTPPSLPETPTLPAPYLPITPPSLQETPTLPAPFLPVTPPSLPETPTLPAPFLPLTPPSLPATPTLPVLPVTPPSSPETPIPNQQAPPASSPPILPGSPTQISENRNACPKDVLKLGVCGDILGRALGNTMGSPPKMPCCKIMEGLLDLEAAVCVCTAIRANVMGIVYDFPIAINNVFNNCQKDLPSGFQCE